MAEHSKPKKKIFNDPAKEELEKIIESSRTKADAYRKILKSLDKKNNKK